MLFSSIIEHTRVINLNNLPQANEDLYLVPFLFVNVEIARGKILLFHVTEEQGSARKFSLNWNSKYTLHKGSLVHPNHHPRTCNVPLLYGLLTWHESVMTQQKMGITWRTDVSQHRHKNHSQLPDHSCPGLYRPHIPQIVRPQMLSACRS